MVGATNAGKSVLLNALTKTKISATSRKRNTTREDICGVLTEGNAQVLFHDTPGFLPDTPGTTLEERRLSTVCRDSLRRAQLVLFVVDAAARLTEKRLAAFRDMLTLAFRRVGTRVVLVLNKVDLVRPKARLLSFGDRIVQLMREVAAAEAERGTVEEVPASFTTFMVSALRENGVDDVASFLVSQAQPGDWEVPATTTTTLSREGHIEQVVRQHLLDNVHDEIPYTTQVEVLEVDEMGGGVAKVHVALRCSSPHHKKIIIGHQARTLLAIRNGAARDLQGKVLPHRIVLVTLHIKLAKRRASEAA